MKSRTRVSFNIRNSNTRSLPARNAKCIAPWSRTMRACVCVCRALFLVIIIKLDFISTVGYHCHGNAFAEFKLTNEEQASSLGCLNAYTSQSTRNAIVYDHECRRDPHLFHAIQFWLLWKHLFYVFSLLISNLMCLISLGSSENWIVAFERWQATTQQVAASHRRTICVDKLFIYLFICV